MWTSSSLAPPYLTPSDLLDAIDERFHSAELHEEAEALIERGELQETPNWEMIPQTPSAWAAYVRAKVAMKYRPDPNARYWHRKQMASRKH